MQDKAEEYVYLICLDAKMQPKGIMELSHGSVDNAYVGIRELLIRVLLLGAANVNVVHNHPSGGITPSREDRAVCRKIKEGCEYVGIDLTDFIVIGGDKYYCFLEEGDL